MALKMLFDEFVTPWLYYLLFNKIKLFASPINMHQFGMSGE